MFGVNIYAIIAVVAVALFCGGFVNGCSYQQSQAEKTIRDKEHQYQANADKIRIDKDAQIKVINTQLVDAISGLRSRSSSATKTINGQDCNGQALSAPDAEFLIREAARADEIRVALGACYEQYESIK
jgi:Na+-transporting NADH:ubiquinone oxidoreductase subunit NqrC